MTFVQKVQHFIEAASEPSLGNTIAASAAATSIFWLNWVRAVSEWAAIFLPIVGIVWLGMQMFVFIRKNRK